MIEAAALISLLRLDWLDFAVVAALLYNAAVGFWQDNKAANALAALKQGLALQARALRDGRWLSVDAADLVPGDLIDVAAGEIVPADALLIGGNYLSVDQSALTGESLPASKRVGDRTFSGSIAKQGTMTAVVTATGNQTFFCRTAKLVASAGAMSHSKRAVLQIGDFLILFAAALAVTLVGSQVYRNVVAADVWTWSTIGAIAQFVLVLLIASVPVAMTGDGVNDAPALKEADCGIAVSGATDAARGAAALILTAPGLSTIVNAIVEAHKIFERIRSYVYYRIAMTLDIMFVVVLAYLFFGYQPLTAIMIVVLALLDDIPIMTIAYDKVQPASRPLRWDMHHILVFSSLMGLLAIVQSFGLILADMEWMSAPTLMARFALDHSHRQTMLFLQLAAGGHLLLFVVRTRRSIFAPPYPSAPLFLAIIATQAIPALMCAYGILVPRLPWSLVGIVWLYVVVWMVVIDLAKLLYYRIIEHRDLDRRRLSDPIAAPSA